MAINQHINSPLPDFQYSAQTNDHVSQSTLGLTYEGIWRNIGQIGLGIQKTRYNKRTFIPGQPEIVSKDSPWLFNAAMTGYVSDDVRHLRQLHPRTGRKWNRAAECNQSQRGLAGDHHQPEGFRHPLGHGCRRESGGGLVRRPEALCQSRPGQPFWRVGRHAKPGHRIFLFRQRHAAIGYRCRCGLLAAQSHRRGGAAWHCGKPAGGHSRAQDRFSSRMAPPADRRHVSRYGRHLFGQHGFDRGQSGFHSRSPDGGCRRALQIQPG